MAPPTKLIVFVVLSTAMSAVVQGTQGDLELSNAPDPGEDPPTGFWDTLGDILGSIWDAVTFLFDLLTWDVPDMPGWLRFILSAPTAAVGIYAIASLIRGGS